MTLFASTLYPQTNPSNAILLHLRERLEFQVDTHFPSTTQRLSRTMLTTLDKRWPVVNYATSEQIDHARRVLTRLASFSG